ncbi:MAG: c-type cytochrome [Gammaproteobacteria bacterium]|nr:c-type cytochrome [Gammaproteobacteria bacterium]NNF60561.1 c-type cytochrome [Gammaproteobacteria bacterium]NNM20257.1 c-type cytochrome [Gammaproteobacteria bacterium]
MKAAIKLSALLALGLCGMNAAAGDVAAGEEKAVTCAACHGAGGAAPISPQYPILAGQHADYLVQSLLQYKNGERKNMIMAGLAAGLSEQDIEDLAAYFSAQSSPLRTVD